MSEFEWNKSQWKRLAEIRDLFLNEDPKSRSQVYWQNQDDLFLYDHSLGRRIYWKWQAVFADLIQLGIELPKVKTVLDWGCGSGVATEAWKEFVSDKEEHFVWDHSKNAVDYCLNKFNLNTTQAVKPNTFDVLLLSHILNEQVSLEPIISLVGMSQTVLWVEPGTLEVSRKLSLARQKLINQGWKVLAPCPHNQACGVLMSGRENHWCHSFAESPQEVHHSRFWRDFAKNLGVDIRRVPMSYLVMTRQDVEKPETKLSKVIGVPKTYKPYAKALLCDQTFQVEDVEIPKKQIPKNWGRYVLLGDGIKKSKSS